ncbi:MAG: hypothetical protein IT562_00410 [Alphaproteobacteria bacterium]|nr:hypothetical protein [Alphaproteobacteria bacterium]
MHARDLLPRGDRLPHLGDDLVEMHRRGVDHPRPLRRRRDHGARHQRSGVEHDGAAADQLEPAHRDQVGRAGTGADEVHLAHARGLRA